MGHTLVLARLGAGHNPSDVAAERRAEGEVEGIDLPGYTIQAFGKLVRWRWRVRWLVSGAGHPRIFQGSGQGPTALGVHSEDQVAEVHTQGRAHGALKKFQEVEVEASA